MDRLVLPFFILFVTVPLSVCATHNRAGEITYKHISGYTYEITVVTYTHSQSYAADRCELTVMFGDGEEEVVYRMNGNPCNSGEQPCNHCGEMVPNASYVKMNIYRTTHTYPSTGKYIIWMLDPNRNEGVLNIPSSVYVPFYIYAELNIFPDGIPNSSPILSNPPIDNACRNVIYEHNPGAVDADISINGLSDSLSYRLVACRGENGNPIPYYQFPDEVLPGPNNQISIDPVTGTLTWNRPQQAGEYNVAILIEEWRKIGNRVIKIGSVLRDLQITVDYCNQNSPPQISVIPDTCVTATQFVNQMVTATDYDNLPPTFTVPQTITLSATGDPFYVVENKASFPKKSGQTSVSQNFEWATQCRHIRSYPYFVVFRAQDNDPDVRLTDYQDWRINVVGPSPEGVHTEAIGSGIKVTWSYPKCTNAAGYRIYRKMDSIGYVAPKCVTGIPASTGYVLAGSVSGGGNTSFFDDDNGAGLISGQRYCYMVYAYFDDGAESYPSSESCTTLLKEVPIITRVSVNSTDKATGSDTVKWSKPTELDQQKYPGPYQYKVLRRDGAGAFVEVASSVSNLDLNVIDTVFVDEQLNTKEKQYSYRIELYGNDSLIGPSRFATSPWLKALPLDNRLRLSLNIDVPWENTMMYVYRQKQDLTFELLDSTHTLIYTDSFLVNGREYCYYITTKGGYSDPELEYPLLNNSQILCAIPEDRQPPCPPQDLKVDSECELFYNDLSWLNPNDICDTTDDVLSYRIYYRPFAEGEMKLMDTVNGATNTFKLYDNLSSVAGCYAVTAVDSFNNESPMSNIVCVDNCPEYRLPNVFTPGKDGQNDVFQPFRGWKYVDKVDMRIYNRWGDEVFSTSDPIIWWEGTNKSGGVLPNGVYFYVCTVYEIRLEGIVERVLKGTVTLLREEPGRPNN